MPHPDDEFKKSFSERYSDTLHNKEVNFLKGGDKMPNVGSYKGEGGSKGK